ncbi:MAG: copper-binding protein, partial [Marinobacter sp.]|nr:copper-binding protein [Marinobacter sp.]
MYPLLRYGVALTVALLSLTAQADLQEQLDALEPGASFELPPEQISSLAIRVPGVSVSCHSDTMIDAGGQGNAVDIVAEEVRFSGCDVRNWGRDLNELDAGIFVAREARGAVVENNRLQGPAFGVWLDATPDATVRNNVIRGDDSLRP